jgi:hypothetical protein
LEERFQRRFLKINQSKTRIEKASMKDPLAIGHFVLIRLKTWPPQAILVSDW